MEERLVRLFSTLSTVAIVAAVVTAFPVNSRGQGLGDFELGVFGGASIFSNESFEIGSPQSSTPIGFRFELDKNFVGGLRVNILTANRWGLESYYSYGTTTASYIQADDPTVRLDLPLQVHGFGASGLYYPVGNGYPLVDNRHKVTPFLIAGVGASIFRPTSEAKQIASDPLQGNLPDIIESSKASFHYGGGVKYRLSREMMVRFDIRGILAGNPTFGLPTESTDPNASVIPLKGMIHNTEITVGFGLNFGSRP